MHNTPSREIFNLENYINSRAKDSSTSAEDDEHAFQTFLKLWEKLPPEWKTRCSKPSQPHRLRVDLWSRDTITIPEDILTLVRLWDQNPSSFLSAELEFSIDPSQDALSRLCGFLHHVQNTSTNSQDIRLRIGQIALHRMKQRLGRSQIRQDTEIETEFVSRIRVESGKAEIIKQSKNWAKNGGKFDTLSTDLDGIGSMICFPPDISRAKIERIPQDGDTREAALACLKERGINNKDNAVIKFCYDVAEKVWNILQADQDSYFLPLDNPIIVDLPSLKKQKQKRRRKERTDTHPSQKKQQTHQTRRAHTLSGLGKKDARQINEITVEKQRSSPDEFALPNLPQAPEQPSGNPNLDVQRTCPQRLYANLVAPGGELVAHPQHGLDKPTSPSQDPEGTALSSEPEATGACDRESGNSSINTSGPMLPRASFGSPQPAQRNLNPGPNLQEAPYWNDMRNPYWDDLVNPYWLDMDVVGEVPNFSESPLDPASVTC